jgi:hypothetical protein
MLVLYEILSFYAHEKLYSGLLGYDTMEMEVKPRRWEAVCCSEM